MLRHRICVLLSFLWGMAAVLGSAARLSAEVDRRLIEAGRRATAYVVIEVPKGLYMGSAFCVDATGIFITNSHVVEPLTKEKDAKIYLIIGPGTKSQRILTPTVLKADAARDVAVLRADRAGSLEALELASPAALASLRETSPVVAFGFPLGQGLALKKDSLPEITITAGRVSALRHDKNQLTLIQFDASVTHGNSGGPLIDEHGQVVGVVTAGIEGKQINFAGPVTSIRSVLAAANVVLTPAFLTNTTAASQMIDWLASDGKSGRTPPPSETVLKQNQKTLKDVLPAQYADKSAGGKYTLILELLTRAANSRNDPAGRYAMLVEARELAIQSGDAPTAAYVAVLIGESYALKPADLLQDVVVRLNGHAAQPSDAAWVSTLGMMLADAMSRREQFSEARRLSPIVRSNGIASKNPTVLAQMRDRLARIEVLAAEFDRVQIAKAKLATTPADPEANLLVGRYLCFTRGDFDTGLPLLAKSSDAALKAVAVADRAKPATPEAKKAIGDQWWDAAAKETKNPVASEACKERAGFWYVKSLPRLEGLAKNLAQKRLEELPPAKVAALAAAVELPPEDKALSSKLNKLDEWKVLAGSWTMVGSHLRGEGSARLAFNSPLPNECTLTFRMNVISGNRPRIFLNNTGITFADLGNKMQLMPHGATALEGEPFTYNYGEEHLFSFHFFPETFEVDIDGKRRFKGSRKAATKIGLNISSGDASVKGTAEFWDFRVISAHDNAASVQPK